MAHPRSTPIPGLDEPVGGLPLPGNASAPAPPTPAEFVGRAVGAPVGLATGTPFAPPRGGAGAPFGGPIGIAPPPGLGGEDAAAAVAAMYVPYRRKRSWLGRLIVLVVVLAGPLAGVGGAVWAFTQARSAIRTSEDLSNPELSAADRDALGLDDTVRTLFEGPAPAAVVAAFERSIGGAPTRFTEILIYSDYAFASAQDPAIPTHVDEYGWRQARVGAPSPEANREDLESELFGAADVDWSAVGRLTAQAPSLLSVEEGRISHVIVGRSSFAADRAVTVRVYVSGPRDSGYLEASATGEVVAAYP